MRVVIGQGSCGVATGAKKTAAEFERLIAENGLDVSVDVTGCVGTCYLSKMFTRMMAVIPGMSEFIPKMSGK